MNNTQPCRRLAVTHLHRYRTNYISDFNDMLEAITGSGVADDRKQLSLSGDDKVCRALTVTVDCLVTGEHRILSAGAIEFLCK